MASLQNFVMGSSLQVMKSHGDLHSKDLSLVQFQPGSGGGVTLCVIQKAAWSPALNLGLRKQFEGKFRLRGDSSTYRKFSKFPRGILSTRNFLQREGGGGGGGGGGGCFKRKFSSMGKKDTRIRSSRQAPEEGEREAQSQPEEEQVLQAEERSERVANDDEYEKLVVQLGSSESPGSSPMRQFVSSFVGTLSGMPHATTDAAESKRNNKNMEQRVKLWWNPLRMLDGGSPSATEPIRRRIADGIHRAEEDFLAFSKELGKYMFIMTATGAILATGFQLSGGESHQEGVLWFSWLAGVVVGSMIGAGQVLESHARSGHRNVVITGSTRGLGKALAREFLQAGDNVVIASRSPESVRDTVTELQQEVEEKHRNLLMAADSEATVYQIIKAKRRGKKVVGIACNVAKSDDVQALADFAVKKLGKIDIWINNAGMNKGFRPLVEFSDEEISQIVSTNLIGSLICTREAIRVMSKQPKGGHIFNMDGAGSGGTSTPLTAAYGATKCGLRQLSGSLLQECKGSRVGIHTASPGMVLTELLLSGASLQNKKMFNIICEQPETVARALVPNLRTVKGTGKAVNYLTPPRIVLAIVNAWFRRGRWFDEEGQAVYAAEAERLRHWAEGREKSPVTAAMELAPSGAWVSLLSSSVLCVYVILSNISAGGSPPGT